MVFKNTQMTKTWGAEPEVIPDLLNYDYFGNIEVVEEFFSIDALAENEWRQPIVDYLKNPIGTTKCKVKYRALNYRLMGKFFFRKTPEGVLLKCLGENEAYVATSEVHSGACGTHQAGQKMKWLLCRIGVY